MQISGSLIKFNISCTYWVSFAMARASSSVLKVDTAKTGPNTSSVQICMWRCTFERTVGSRKYPFVKCCKEDRQKPTIWENNYDHSNNRMHRNCKSWLHVELMKKIRNAEGKWNAHVWSFSATNKGSSLFLCHSHELLHLFILIKQK